MNAVGRLTAASALIAAVVTGAATPTRAAPQSPLPRERVIVRFDAPERMDGLAFTPSRRFASLPGVAASLTAAQVEALAARPGTVAIEPDRIAHKSMDTARAGFGVDNAASDYGVDGTGITAAVLDTGIDAAHPAFAGGKVVAFENFASNDPNDGCVDQPQGAVAPFDDDGHGTHVASIIAGAAPSTFHGVAPNAHLVGVKVLDCNGDGFESDILAGMQWVIDHHSDPGLGIGIMNLSLGFPEDTDGTDSPSVLANRAVAAGIATFVAAGNAGPQFSTVTAPATAKWAVGVGAMSDPGDTQDGAPPRWPPGFGLAPFSSRGPTTDGRVKPDIVAAGLDITAAAANTANGTTIMSGTSMASPFAAGVGALLLQANPALAPHGSSCPTTTCPDGVVDGSMFDGVASTLRSTAVDFGPAGPDNAYGAGRLDAYAAVRSAKNDAAGALGAPVVPHHTFATGSLAGGGACDSWPVTVTTPEAVAVALDMTSWTDATHPNFEIELRDQAGNVIANKRQQRDPDTLANIETREEILGHALGSGGFELRVRSVAGAGPYQFDLSGGTLGAVAPCPGLTLSPAPVSGGLHYGEGSQQSFTLALDRTPSSPVTVTMTPPSFVTLNPPGPIQLSTTTPTTVIASTAQDTIASGDRSGAIAFALTSGDTGFNNAPTTPMPVTVLDDDTPGVTLTATSGSVSEANPNAGVTYSLSLRSQPTATVTVHVGPDAQLHASPSTLTFDGANWQTPQPVNVTVVDDPFVERSPHTGRVHNTVTSGDPVYNDIAAADFVATITDNDIHGLAGAGYRMVASDGGIFSFGDARFFGSTGNITLNQPIVGMATTRSGDGYWLVARDGGIFAFGDARFFGSTGGIHLTQPIVGIAATPSGNGYWLVARDGGIFAFGDARFFGSTGGIRLNQPIVAMTPTPTGNGYWLVASDGGVFPFGDAAFLGSTGNLHLTSPVIAMAAAPDGSGYWLLASDGGIFSFGTSRFLGSTGDLHLNAPIVGFGPTPFGDGYWLVASDGGIFSFGDAGFLGSTGNLHLNHPIVQLSA